ncbi:cache domain-containing sensor histidine kinase [Paenibacillus harenae]|uniref:cache domain-containing sensor histidine kinase n=1 Tax=Paenibacillus harenae TaxID=306543 RepID=UPI00040B5D71|nr:sensor histidine kinase [Paenibacillus harenae]
MISELMERLRFRHYRLSTKLIVTYMLLTVIPMFLLGYISYSQYTKSIEEQIGEYMPKFLVQANTNIQKQMEELTTLPDSLFNSGDIIAILRKDSYQNHSDLNKDQFTMNSYLARTYINGNNTDVIGVFLLSKNRLFQSTKMSYSGLDWSSSPVPYGQDPDLRGKAKMILPSEIGMRFTNNVPYVLVMKQINDVDNRKNLGTMFIAVQLSFIDAILSNFEQNDEADLWVMNGGGELIYHTDPKKIGSFDSNIGSYPILNGSFRTSDAEGPRLVSVSEFAGLDWILVHSIPLKYLTERTDLFRYVTITVLIGIVIVSSIIAVMFSLNLTRPLKQLTRLMKQVETGNLKVDLKVKNKDEVGTLAHSFNAMIAQIRELVQKNYEIEIRQKEAELYALQSQINPHFMYNTLETIGMAVEEGEKETVVEMVTLLGRMLRFSVSNKSKFVTIALEVRHVRDYMTIQKFRFEDRLAFEIVQNVEGGDDQPLYSPNFILQPIVENAIKYGLSARKGVNIHISVNREFGARSGKQDVVFRIRDDGPGIPSDRLSELEHAFRTETLAGKDSGFGLTNVNARIVMLHGSDYGVQLHTIYGKGTEVILRIPVLIMSEAAVSSENGG